MSNRIFECERHYLLETRLRLGGPSRHTDDSSPRGGAVW
jgi:hypothetical protein